MAGESGVSDCTWQGRDNTRQGRGEQVTGCWGEGNTQVLVLISFCSRGYNYYVIITIAIMISCHNHNRSGCYIPRCYTCFALRYSEVRFAIRTAIYLCIIVELVQVTYLWQCNPPTMQVIIHTYHTSKCQCLKFSRNGALSVIGA